LFRCSLIIFEFWLKKVWRVIKNVLPLRSANEGKGLSGWIAESDKERKDKLDKDLWKLGSKKRRCAYWICAER